MKHFIWLSFDLGVRGDFEGMYAFLDEHGAKECGDSMAAFSYEFKKDLLAELTKDIQSSVTLDRRARVYVVYPKKDRHFGKFIIGKRKSAAWAGFAPGGGDEEDVGE
jgi:hypothetical protein